MAKAKGNKINSPSHLNSFLSFTAVRSYFGVFTKTRALLMVQPDHEKHKRQAEKGENVRGSHLYSWNT
jgi:hypothetical protein